MPGFIGLAVAVGAAGSVVVGAMVGGWTPAVVTEQQTQLLTSALTRVDAENGALPRLQVVEILSLETQVVAGTNYRFTVAAKDLTEVEGGAESDAPVDRFLVKVFEQPWTNTLRVTAVDRVHSAGDDEL